MWKTYCKHVLKTSGKTRNICWDKSLYKVLYLGRYVEVDQSLSLQNFRNVILNSCSRAHVDQVRNSPSKKYHITDMKICEIFQERISDGVLFLQINCPSNCNLDSTADVSVGFFWKISEQLFLRATLAGSFCQGKVC